MITEITACRTLAIVFNVSGLRGSVSHIETGVLVEPGDVEQLVEAITHLLMDHELRNRLVENAYKYAQQYGWDKTARSFITVIKRAIDG